MADNYLEKKMEDLRLGKTSHTRRTFAKPASGGKICFEFPPRRVLVTGGANGIGEAIADAFIKASCKVAVFDTDCNKGTAMARNRGIRFSEVDISVPEQLEKAFADLIEVWRDVDIIINNAGVSSFKPLTEGNLHDFDHIINTNLRPAYLLGHLWAIHRRKYPSVSGYGGRIINISSTRHAQSECGTEAYTASKGGLTSLTHALMMSMSEFGITVNSISPGWIHTCSQDSPTPADNAQHPSRRVGRPEDIASLALFLSLPSSDFINGADIPVDGGMTHKMIYC